MTFKSLLGGLTSQLFCLRRQRGFIDSCTVLCGAVHCRRPSVSSLQGQRGWKQRHGMLSYQWPVGHVSGTDQ